MNEKIGSDNSSGVIIFTLSSCDHTKNLEDVQTDTVNRTTEISNSNGINEAETDLYESEYTDYDELENLIGEYDYLSDDGIGKLIIKKTSYGYDISDYESESSYRFLADSSNIETIENNRIYIKYPEQVFSDGTVIFSYYILEYSTDEINVYYGKSVPEEAQFLYHAMKKIEKIVDYEALGIEEYIYPSEFFMGDNLKAAITQLALSYENFDKDCVSNESWKETFVAKFIQNSRILFDYLDLISDKNNGQISTDELNYIQYSLTNTELDFSSYTDGSVNRNDSASSLNYGWISEYDYEYTDSGVVITADFEVGYDGTDSIQKREITVELVKNPYSCFDGYSVVALSQKYIPIA